MAIKLISTEYCACLDKNVYHYVLDSASDAAGLPECATGSTAMVAEKDGALYMVNASGDWEEL